MEKTIVYGHVAMTEERQADSWKEFASSFSSICGDKYVITDPEQLYWYGRDQTLNLHYEFDILLKPGTTEEIAAILKFCNTHCIPVTPRGGGSGVSGGALPVKRGVVLSLERLNRILEINTEDAYVMAEAGVITADLCKAVQDHGLYYPVAPSSSTYSCIGGNVAQNAGSISSCRYGTTADYVLNLQVVLPCGDVVWTGANVLKNATGFNLTQLFTGSEGVLGIITRIVFRLIKYPAYNTVLLMGFNSMERAFGALQAIRSSALLPSAAELITRGAIDLTAAYINAPLPLIKTSVHAHLLVELQEHTEEDMRIKVERIVMLAERFTEEEILVADAAAEKEQLRKLRHSIGAAMTHNGLWYRDIDVCVPPSQLSGYLKAVEETATRHGLQFVCFGHALDGNMHTMLLLNKHRNDQQEQDIKMALHEIYSYAVSVNGVLSGEHGIGLIQKEYMALQFPPVLLSLMRNIKLLLDPNNILNPGKII